MGSMAMRSKASVALVLFAIFAQTRPAICASASGTAQVTVFRALSITANRTLRFGTLIRPAAGSGTAVIDTVGSGGLPGGGGGAAGGAGTDGKAGFSLVGESAQSRSVSGDP